jgi:Cellulase (glycosyl hydrolase family 5)
MKTRWAFPLLLSFAVGACATPESIDNDGGSTGQGGQTGGQGNGGHAGGGTTGTAGSSGPGSGGSTSTGGTGVTGLGGTTGQAGTTGTTGVAGTNGRGGSTGSTGTAGTTGTTGVAGTNGRGGSTGTTGTAGTTGTTGVAGTTGTAGTTGKGGTTGTAGTTGKGGTTGAAGTNGTAGTMGKAGTSGTAGTSGAAGTSGSTGICNFASGLNVAWVNFANDVPSPNLTTFNTIFKNTYAAGGRVVRWWFHTNGTVTPGYDSSGKAKPLQQSHIDGVKAILNAAHSAGIAVNISLWSFDMLQANAGTAHTNNQALLEVDANRQAYIDNYLTPLVTALKGTPGLYSYEIFNEPEGMGPNGWATYRTTEAAIQKCVNWFAAAIHAADPNVLVTNGAVTFDYCSTVSGKTNYYSDSALRNVGGKQGGTLNFYEVHYYTSNGTSTSCFMHPASYWGLDKKLVMGEFAAATTQNINQNDLYTYLYTNGYNGAWAWSYDADYPWPDMQTAMQNVYNAHMSDVNSCP